MAFNTDILDDKAISAYGKLVYFALSKYAGRNGNCWPSIKTLSATVGISNRSTQRAISELVSKQWIKKEKRKTECGDYDSNLYSLPRIEVVSDRHNLQSHSHNSNDCESGQVVSDMPINLSSVTYPMNLLTDNEKNILDLLKNVPGYKFKLDTDLAFIRDLQNDFPMTNVLDKLKGWKVWLLDHPLKKTSNPRSQIRNWLKPKSWEKTAREPTGRSKWLD